MKVKELIKVFEACDPNAEVQCSWQSNGEAGFEYRKACCNLVMGEPYTEEEKKYKTAPLESFSVIGAQVENGFGQSVDGLCPILILDQDFFCDNYVYEAIQNMHKKNG